MTAPLISRPGYGEGGSALPRGGTPVAESKLPSGPPTEKGRALDEGISGQRTFAKPEEDVREPETGAKSIYRVDGPDSLAKREPNDEVKDDRERPSFKPSMGDPDGRPKDDQAVTRYPYRDGVPNAHNASAHFVAEAWQLLHAPERLIGVAHGLRTGARADGILEQLDGNITQKAEACKASLKRADIANLRWLFSVDCGNGARVVRIKAERAGNVTRLAKMDLKLTCSCPAWRWLGSEHHAKQDGYLEGKAQGTASVPLIRDPQGRNRVCKHVAAALGMSRDWTIPAGRKTANDYVSPVWFVSL